jgi:glycosyltransferase involved in cell wall biosynthesis
MKRNDLRLLVLAHANRTAGPRCVATNLIRALAGLGPDIQVSAVMPAGCGYEAMVGECRLTPIWFDQKGSRQRRLVFDMAVLPRMARRCQPHAILALGSIGLLRPQVPQAVLVQDPHFVYPSELYGNMTPMEHLRYFLQRRQLRLSIARSAIVYCQTPVMLERVRNTYGRDHNYRILPKCVTTTHRDVSPRPGSAAEVLHAHESGFRLVCLCQYYAHKNLEVVCDVFEQFGEALKGVVVFLTIAANHHIHAGALLRRIERSGLSDRIINLGPIPESEIPACLRNCEGLLLPAKMESFSGAYLDAMQCGRPILTSDLDFAREVCGEAACYFDPWSPKSVSEAIVRLKQDPSLWRQLAEAGSARLRQNYSQSWTEVASRVVEDLKACVCVG